MVFSESIIADNTVDLSFWVFMNLTKPLLPELIQILPFLEGKFVKTIWFSLKASIDENTVDLSILDFINLDHTVPGKIDPNLVVFNKENVYRKYGFL